MPVTHEFQEQTDHWNVCPEKIIQLKKKPMHINTCKSLLLQEIVSEGIGLSRMAAMFCFVLGCVAWRILFPQSGNPWIEPLPPAVEAQSQKHWTTREIPRMATGFDHGYVHNMFMYVIYLIKVEQDSFIHMQIYFWIV